MDTPLFSKQVRMARAALNWTVRDLAEKADISPDTVIRAEKGDLLVKRSAWGAIQNALENAGIELFENGSVLLHTAMSVEGVKVSPDMPLGVRRIYGYGMFQEGNIVRWKKANSTDPESNMRIVAVGRKKALCEYVVTTGGYGLSVPPPIVENKQDWFLLSELEHVFQNIDSIFNDATSVTTIRDATKGTTPRYSWSGIPRISDEVSLTPKDTRFSPVVVKVLWISGDKKTLRGEVTHGYYPEDESKHLAVGTLVEFSLKKIGGIFVDGIITRKSVESTK